MASTNYQLHPNSNTLPMTVTTDSNTDARTFYFIPEHYMQTLTSITVPHYMQQQNASETQYKWSNKCDYDNAGTTACQGENRESALINSFNPARQILCARVQLTANYTHQITMPSITATGTYGTLNKVSIGDTVTKENMDALRTYLNNYCNGIDIGTSQTVAQITRNNKIFASDWTSYIAKANALPHVSGLQVPAQNSDITAAYYNNIVDAIL